jgi:predicted dehydrogenase
MFGSSLTYQHEFSERVRVGLVGCGGQAFRNIIPSFRFAPIELVSTCDPIPGRAARFAADYGAASSYTGLNEMLESEQLDAVLLATGYGEDHRPTHPEHARTAMAAGCHVWMEKPAAAAVRDIEAMHDQAERTGSKVAVGLMKMFSPAVTKVRQITRLAEFGQPSTFYLRDPELLPERRDDESLVWLLDHLPHPAALIHRLMGPISRISIERAHNGAAFVMLRFTSGASGVLHMPWGQSGMSPYERFEVVGEGANVVVENNTRITYYRPGHRGDEPAGYGRMGDYTSTLDAAPLHWETSQYSGQPYNANVFLHGYAQEIRYFAECVLHDRPVRVGGLADAWHVTRFFEAVRDYDSGFVDLKPGPEWTLPADEDAG